MHIPDQSEFVTTFEQMVGKTFIRIEVLRPEEVLAGGYLDFHQSGESHECDMDRTLSEASSDVLLFEEEGGALHLFFNEAECCEMVILYDVQGEISTLLGSPLLKAELLPNAQVIEEVNIDEWGCECAWSVFTFETIAGCVSFRWFGQSNCHLPDLKYCHMVKNQ